MRGRLLAGASDRRQKAIACPTSALPTLFRFSHAFDSSYTAHTALRGLVNQRLLAVALAAAGLAFGQVRQSLMEEVGKDNLPSQQLGVDDLVAVSVYDAPELTRTVRVEADGTIHLPLLHAGIAATGLFSRDLEESIANELTTEQILVNPVVKVTVVEYHSRPVAVMGAVKLPLTFQAVGVVTLLDALAKAGGLSELAGSEILVSRGLDASNTTEHVLVKQLLNDADPAVNFVLHGGETIRVPEAGKIFVMGNVKKPGAFLVRDGSENSVLKLVALAEGLAPFPLQDGVCLSAGCGRRTAGDSGGVG